MAYPEYANIEVFQGEDFEMTVDLSSDTAYSFTDKTFEAFLAADHKAATSRVEFVISDISAGSKTMKLKLTKDLTQALADDFDGYWDLMSKDSSTGLFRRLLQGEAKVFPQVTKDEDFA